MEAKMKEDLLQTLTDYFNGPCMTHASISLAMPIHSVAARKFFETREKLGIKGYISNEAALEAVKKALT